VICKLEVKRGPNFYKDTIMARKEIFKQLKEVLIRRREALRQALAGDLRLLNELREQTSGDIFDFAADAASDEINSQIAEAESRELLQIEEALERIREGTYGICDDCSKAIPLVRLQALPYATECIECKRKSEMGGSSLGGWRGIDTRTFGYNSADTSL
jgi:DnaK suppressor protein